MSSVVMVYISNKCYFYFVYTNVVRKWQRN